MDLQQLKIFLHVAALKSFSRAAEQLYMSQPNVSTRIKKLERELGVDLFDRSRSRELELTEDGRILLDYAQRMLNLEEETREALQDGAAATGGLVRIGASTVPGIYLLPQRLAIFKESFPAVDYSLTVMDSGAVLDGIFDYSFDVGFVGSALDDERLQYHPLAEDELVLAVRPGLIPQLEGGAIPIARCLAQPLLVREPGSATRSLLEKALQRKGLSLADFKSVIYMNSLEAIKQGVRYGLGVAFLSECSVVDYRHMKLVDTFRLADLDLTRSFYLVYHRHRILSRAAQSFIAFISPGA
ncbi:MAG: LysR family transcriptional regulator [Firmicutes bacterium]|jgi:DNA-binding transcriptional LysR family regulator|nr:LysR family transcriptional regulator [Bacillota bacterium]